MNKIIFLTLIIILLFSSNIIGAEVKYFQLEESQEVFLNFPGSKVRVESWYKDYIKIETTYMVKNNYDIQQKNNMIYFNKVKHLKRYPNDLDNNKLFKIVNEVFFIITVPANKALNITADQVNIKENCKLKFIDAEYTRIREANFLDGFIGKGKKIVLRDNDFNGKYTLDYESIIREKRKGLLWNLGKLLLK